MRTLTAALVALLAAACASPPTAPAVVKQAVPEAPCVVSVPPRPVFPADALTGTEDLFTIGKTLLADIRARAAYELQLETALGGCTRASTNEDRPP